MHGEVLYENRAAFVRSRNGTTNPLELTSSQVELSKPREDSWRPIGSNLVLRGCSGRVFLEDPQRTKGAGTHRVPAPLGLPVESVPDEISG
jgi:hypothetical protein